MLGLLLKKLSGFAPRFKGSSSPGDSSFQSIDKKAHTQNTFII
jgi:hypothetical protein